MKHWTKPLAFLFGLWLLALPTGGQEPESAQSHGETKSPDGTLVVYHLDYDYYAPESSKPPMVFRVAKASSGEVVHQIEVPSLGKVPPTIEWIDERFVLVRSMLASILDVDAGTATETAYGFRFEIAPDRRSIAYLHGYVPRYFDPRDPPEDHVFVWHRGKDAQWKSTVVYPEGPAPQVRIEEEPPFEERDLLASNFAWAPNGKQLAFLIYRGGKYELVVLDIEESSGDLLIQRSVLTPPSKAGLPEFEDLTQMHQVARLVWTKEPTEGIKVVRDGKSFQVSLPVSPKASGRSDS